MSTNYTENYNLCQWEPLDKVLREDFNADNAKLEEALSRIETTANAAKAIADTAFTPGKPQVIVGTYRGDLEPYQDINLGFAPRFVFVTGPDNQFNTGTTGEAHDVWRAFAIRGFTSSITPAPVALTSNGFRVSMAYSPTRVCLNDPTYTYSYLAVR